MKTISLKVRDTSSATFSGLKPSSCILALQQMQEDNVKVELVHAHQVMSCTMTAVYVSEGKAAVR